MWQGGDDAESLAALARALALGINLFDTAYVYGDGHSEKLLARAFEAAGRGALVATKVPPKNFRWPGAGKLSETFPPDWVIHCTERSLRNLRRDCVDVQQFHVWRDAWLDDPAWGDTWKAVETLKRQGKIRFWGASINDFDPGGALRLAGSGLADTIQVIFNLFEQAPQEELFPACRERGVGILARVPLDEGGLTGNLTEATRFPDGDFRNSYFAEGRLAETVRRARALEPVLVGADSPDLAHAALRFTLSSPDVSTVIPGMRRPAHVEANVAAASGAPYPEPVLRSLRAHAWKRTRG